MSSLIPHDYRYKISSPTPVDKEPLKKTIALSYCLFIDLNYPFTTSEQRGQIPCSLTSETTNQQRSHV